MEKQKQMIGRMVKNETALIVGGGLVLLGALWWVSRNPAAVGSAIGSTVGGAVTGAAGGVVQGVGSVLGVPVTNASKCAACKKIKDYLGVSKYCSAASFFQYLLTGK